MQDSIRRWSALGLASLQAACAPGIALYDKPGLTYAEWKHDDAECRRGAGREGDAATDREAYARCMGARGYKLRAE